MMRILATIFLTLLLYSCTRAYQPENVSIYDKHIRDFVVSGNVTVTSVNLQEPPTVIWDNLVTFETSYTHIARSIATQLSREIVENSTVDGDLNKNLYVQVDNFYLEPYNETLKMHMNFTLLGDRGFEKHFAFKGQPTERSANSMTGSFDKAIALSVQKILKNSEVLQYLASQKTQTY